MIPLRQSDRGLEPMGRTRKTSWQLRCSPVASNRFQPRSGQNLDIPQKRFPGFVWGIFADFLGSPGQPSLGDLTSDLAGRDWAEPPVSPQPMFPKAAGVKPPSEIVAGFSRAPFRGTGLCSETNWGTGQARVSVGEWTDSLSPPSGNDRRVVSLGEWRDFNRIWTPLQ